MSVISISTLLINSILIIPFLQFFIPILYCKEVNNTYTDNITCFSGSHLIFFCFGLIGTCYIICFGIANAIFNYDIIFMDLDDVSQELIITIEKTEKPAN
jgi:hypothetical protein